jgi:hypothetical protein
MKNIIAIGATGLLLTSFDASAQYYQQYFPKSMTKEYAINFPDQQTKYQAYEYYTMLQQKRNQAREQATNRNQAMVFQGQMQQTQQPQPPMPPQTQQIASPQPPQANNAGINAEIIPEINEGFLSGFFKTSPEYTNRMLNWQTDVTGKQLNILNARKTNLLADDKIYIGGVLKGSFMAETTNEDDKFPILSRLPGQHSGDNGTRAVINNSALSVTANPTSYATAFFQLEYSEIEYPGQDDLQLRKAYAVFGDLSVSPFYLMFGRNTIDFGDNDTYSPFTHSVNNHFFNAVSDDPTIALGYVHENIHFVLTGINGGRQLRVADMKSSAQFNNFAAHLELNAPISDFGTLKWGGGYLRGTIYNANVAHHTDTLKATATDFRRNPAWNAFVEFTSDHFDIMGEYTFTGRDWLVTNERVQAITGQAAVKTDIYDIPFKFSGVYGLGLTGSEGTEFERSEQAVAGVEAVIDGNLTVGAEYVYNKAFTPLINITTTSDASVEAHTGIVGGKLTF